MEKIKKIRDFEPVSKKNIEKNFVGYKNNKNFKDKERKKEFYSIIV